MHDHADFYRTDYLHSSIFSDAPDGLEKFYTSMKFGKAFVVHDLKPRSDIWNANWFVKNFGETDVEILDCRNAYDALPNRFDEEKQIQPYKVSEFFDGFVDETKRLVGPGAILKLKDWPSTTELGRLFPQHLDDFTNILPFREWVAVDGPMNLASRLPDADAKLLDLGPKMYIAYGSEDMGKNAMGMMVIHLDMADMVNIMMFAVDP